MLALLKRNFILYFRNRSGVFFSLLGALISFLPLYHFFAEELDGCLGPNSLIIRTF